MGADLVMTVEGKEIKVVPESDLIAAKRGLEGKVDELKTQYDGLLSESKKTADGHYQNLLKEKSSAEELMKKVKELEPLPTKVQELTTLFETGYKNYSDLLNQHTDLKKNYLKELYGLPDDKLTGKSIEDLSTLEMGLKAAGIKPRTGGGYDMGTGGASGSTKTGVDLCADEIAAIKKKMGIQSN